MDDLISKSKLIEDLKTHFDALYREDGELLASDHICNSEDVNDLIELVNEQPTVNTWTSVKKSLPPEPRIGEDGYIVQKKNVCEPFSAYWDGERWTDSNCDPIDEVLAWMPLPNKYISEE